MNQRRYSIVSFLFGFSGRISRLEWWIGFPAIFLADYLIRWAIRFGGRLVFDSVPWEDAGPILTLLPAASLAVSILAVWSSCALATKRARQLNHNGMPFVLLLLLRAVAPLLVMALFLDPLGIPP